MFCTIYELTLKKTKLKYVFGSRKIEKLPGNFDDLEKTMWQYYFKELSGSGAYYTYVKADEIISKYVRSRKLKERYRALLKCVAHYKGLAPFFRHIGKPDPHFSDINYFKDNETALRDIRGLEAIGVNPVTISRRMATDSLPNIIELIK